MPLYTLEDGWPYPAGEGCLPRSGKIAKGGSTPSEAWLAARQCLVTGTDAPYLYGKGYDSYPKWLEKKTSWPAPSVAVTEAMRFGTDAEPALLQYAADELKTEFDHCDHVFWCGLLGASPDGISKGGTTLVECKTTSGKERWPAWEAQVMHTGLVLSQLGVPLLRAFVVVHYRSTNQTKIISCRLEFPDRRGHLSKCCKAAEDLGYVLTT